jgi:hypothetical protein
MQPLQLFWHTMHICSYYINFVDLRLCADNDTLETSLTEPASAMGVSAWRQRIDMM